jgi:hypothetical protein
MINPTIVTGRYWIVDDPLAEKTIKIAQGLRHDIYFPNMSLYELTAMMRASIEL